MSWFLFSATVISLSGVMAPGPMTAATLAAGTRGRHAGALIALGHAVIEIPLMLVIVAGAAAFFKHEAFQLTVGLAGGALLLLMGVQMLFTIGKTVDSDASSARRHPFLIGIILTGANPYFLLWWAGVGLALATEAAELGIMAFVLFAIIHWLCDLVWLEALSFAGHKGSQLLRGRVQQIVLLVCGILLLYFGCAFLYDGGCILRS
ncbi:MAG: LysE family transporter [Candidatus Nealsonbacteria bacterium]|nr:LysE family transporter [Candidatus Nealsonbacteria bacterium]